MPSRVAAGTSTGLVRKRNEDGVYVGHWLCAVADGMGGHAAGDLASATVIEAIRPFDIAVTPDRLTATLGRAVRGASDLVAARAEADPDVASMGPRLRRCSGRASHGCCGPR
jgi:PPM family protein phosphatase